ncbi:hypothetical protein ABEG18_19095 [Alsobacter sp. KACC 23698]|uniref:Uncharacterized protein n=1 Tax=Alsobacter sp. KACC 23698 TaxID=3149229 RepID=A0AAU7JBZ0_9HYPH
MNSKRPWELVTDPNYFRGLMGTMGTAGLGPKEDVWLRIGNMGDGKQPNYQVHGPDGRVIRFHGGTHGKYHENTYVSFEPENLSQEIFTYPDVVKLLARCLGKV